MYGTNFQRDLFGVHLTNSNRKKIRNTELIKLIIFYNNIIFYDNSVLHIFYTITICKLDANEISLKINAIYLIA